MAGTFMVEWLPGGVLLQRRSGLLTTSEANAYAAAVRKALLKAPARWGAVVDVREATAQTDEVQAIIQDLIKYVVSKRVCRIAFVTSSAITGIQQRRITTAPGMHDPSTVAFYEDYDGAVSAIRAIVAEAGKTPTT